MMKTRTWIAVLALLFLFLPLAVAQQKGADPRVNPPAAPYPPLSTTESSSTADKDAAVPDARKQQEPGPLNTVEADTLGSLDVSRSYLAPSLQFAQVVDTNNNVARPDVAWRSLSLLQGRLALERVWSRYHLTTRYGAGGLVYNNDADRNRHFHELGLIQRIAFRRWNLLLGNHTTYLPESDFGFEGLNAFGGFGSLGDSDLGGRTGIINRAFLPNQTVLTRDSQRISNATMAQVLYRASPRSYLTAATSYGILHFLDPGFLDGRSWVTTGGYNYLVSPRDTIGVLYSFSQFGFSGGVADSFNTHGVHIGYGRKVTDRMSLSLSAGPDFRRLPGPSGRELRTSWAARSTLLYRFQRSSLALTYNHHLTGGSGVLRGARTHTGNLRWQYQLTRMWHSELRAGYSRNASLDGQGQVFTGWVGGANLGRSLGRQTRLFLSYNLQRQSSDRPFCLGADCGRVTLRHYFGLGLSFNFRPVDFE